MQDTKFDIIMQEIKNAHKTRAIKDITKKVVIVIQRNDDLIEDLFTASVFQYHSLVFLGYSGFNEHDKRLIIPRTIEDESEGNEVVVMDDQKVKVLMLIMVLWKLTTITAMVTVMMIPMLH